MSAPEVVQSDAIYDALSSFYQALSTALQNYTAPPSASDIASSLTYTDLQTAASINSKYAPTFAVGSAVETAHLAAAVLREYGMRARGKSDYYSTGISEHSTESDYFDRLKYMHRSTLEGSTISGSLTQ